jgi:DNA mismatch endonuclease (patch repair protein)
MPKSNAEFWKSKFEANVARDERVKAELEAMGWTVSVIWECETKMPEVLRAKIEQIFSEDLSKK